MVTEHTRFQEDLNMAGSRPVGRVDQGRAQPHGDGQGPGIHHPLQLLGGNVACAPGAPLPSRSIWV